MRLWHYSRRFLLDKAASRIDDEMSVLIEGYLYEDDIYIGRTYMDAPKVDGNVFVRAEEELISGDMTLLLALREQMNMI